MKLTITIDCDNDAFRAPDGASATAHACACIDEAERILGDLAERGLDYKATIRLLDRNGNTVGKAEWSEE
jgi:hypothetical protein